MRLRLLVVLWLLITCGNVLTQTAPPASNVAGDIPRVRLAESVVAGLRMKYVHPIYPSAASNARIHGDVVLRILIGIDGQVTVLAIVSGPLALRDAARKAVAEWKYGTYERCGQACEVVTLVRVPFRLTEKSKASQP